MIDLNEFAREVHANAVSHGWYDNGERTEAEIFANIHSEWSEAFDAYAHGEPWYYHHCGDPATKDEICENFAACYSRKIGWDGDHCFMRNKKPEGIAVELIDGVIRILDFVEYYKEKHNSEAQIIYKTHETAGWDISELISWLHESTVETFRLARGFLDMTIANCTTIITLVFGVVAKMGLDPEKIMLEKHEYNKTRPYRHGGKVV